MYVRHSWAECLSALPVTRARAHAHTRQQAPAPALATDQQAPPADSQLPNPACISACLCACYTQGYVRRREASYAYYAAILRMLACKFATVRRRCFFSTGGAMDMVVSRLFADHHFIKI